MKYTCKNCGKEFNGKPSAKRIYCSKKCHDESQSKKVIVTCSVCGNTFEKSPSTVRENNLCSNSCRKKWLSKRTEEINVAGHSKGHKAPHLTKLNRERNPKLALEADAAKRGSYQGKKHRREMERILGRRLLPHEDVHHINGIHDDNRPENLVAMDHSEHLRLHWQQAKERGVI